MDHNLPIRSNLINDFFFGHYMLFIEEKLLHFSLEISVFSNTCIYDDIYKALFLKEIDMV